MLWSCDVGTFGELGIRIYELERVAYLGYKHLAVIRHIGMK